MARSTDRRRNPRDTTIENTVSRYLDSLNSGGSRISMRPALKHFTQFCEDQGVEYVEEIETRDLREFGLELRERYSNQEIKESTAHNYFRYVRSFLSFCVRDELLDSNPAKTNRATEYLPEDTGDRKRQFWSEKQRKQIINYATKRVDMALDGKIKVDPEQAYRDRTMVVLLAETGARGAELFNDRNDEKRNGITWNDIDLEKRVLYVFGKSRTKNEEVPLPSAAREALDRYKRFQDPPTDEWPVFPTAHAPTKYSVLPDEIESGEKDIDDVLREHQIAPPAITKEGARSVMKRLTDEANIELDDEHDYLTPHGARRALGADLYASGESEKAQQVLRHQSIETTHEAYSDLKTGDLADSIDEIRD